MMLLVGCNWSTTERNEYLLKKANEAQESSHDDQAIRLLDKGIQNDSNLLDAYILKGRILNKINKSGEALIVFRKAVQLDTRNTSSLYYLGTTYYLLEKNDSAISYLNKAMATKGGDSVYLEFNKNNPIYAKTDIDMTAIRYARGLAYYYSSNDKNAAMDFLFCMGKNYRLPECYLFVGSLYVQDGLGSEGCEYLQKAFEYGKIEAKPFLEKYCK
jgi:tetratricopeptide (TPR) repeat protein